MSNASNNPEPKLTTRSEAAVDALMEQGLWSSAESRPARLLKLLDPASGVSDWSVADRKSLIDLTMARIIASQPAEQGPRLCDADKAALDALADCQGAAELVEPSLRQRAHRHADLAQAVRTGPALAAGSLVERTMARVERAAADRPMPIERYRTRLGTRWADLVSIAGVLLIGVSVVWPMISVLRHQAQRSECSSSLASVAQAMGLYAGDNQSSLPVTTASLAGRLWDVDPSRPVANSSNLFTLVRNKYSKLTDFACVGNPHAQRESMAANAWDWSGLDRISYSYRIMFGTRHPRWSDPAHPSGVIVMSDRSPVVLRAVRGEVIYPFENSPNHNGRGQQVVSTDGSVGWIESPVVHGDNIWLPRGVEEAIARAMGERWGKTEPIRGTEVPQGAGDVFLGP